MSCARSMTHIWNSIIFSNNLVHLSFQTFTRSSKTCRTRKKLLCSLKIKMHLHLLSFPPKYKEIFFTKSFTNLKSIHIDDILDFKKNILRVIVNHLVEFDN